MSSRAAPALLVAGVAVSLPGAASAQAPAAASPGTITAIGTSSVKPVPADANDLRRRLIGRSCRCRVPIQVTATEAVTFAAVS